MTALADEGRIIKSCSAEILPFLRRITLSVVYQPSGFLKKSGKLLPVLRKTVPLQAEYYQNCTKSLIFSTLLCQVSVVTAHARIGFLFFRVINLLIF